MSYYKNTKDQSYPATPHLNKLQPNDCIQYPHCRAQLCPLEGSWKKFQNYQSNNLCFLIAEAVKPNPWVLPFYPKELLGDIRKLLPSMKQQHPFVFEQEKAEEILNPLDCDRFNICSAMICPLDPEWRKRKLLKGERVCNYLTDAVKNGAEAIFRDAGRGGLYEVIQTHLPDIIATHVPIRFACERAIKTGFRLSYKQEVAK